MAHYGYMKPYMERNMVKQITDKEQLAIRKENGADDEEFEKYEVQCPNCGADVQINVRHGCTLVGCPNCGAFADLVETRVVKCQLGCSEWKQKLNRLISKILWG